MTTTEHPYRLFILRISLLGALFCILSSHAHAQDLRSCDLVFQLSGNSDFSKAISTATFDEHDFDFSHVGILERDSLGKLNVIEASPAAGVRIISLADFLDSSPKIDGQAGVVVKRVTMPVDSQKILTTAKLHLGEDYDWYFLPDNGRMYCSELVYEAFIDSEGKHIFETVPMNFKGPDGKIPDFWIELFSRLSQEVPQGKPGTNPNDLSKSQWLTTVYKFF